MPRMDRYCLPKGPTVVSLSAQDHADGGSSNLSGCFPQRQWHGYCRDIAHQTAPRPAVTRSRLRRHAACWLSLHRFFRPVGPPFCPNKRAIQCTLFEIKFSFEFKLRKEHVPYTGKGSILCPSPMSSPCRDITAVFSWKISPSTSRCQNEENRFEGLFVIGRGATCSSSSREMWLNF